MPERRIHTCRQPAYAYINRKPGNPTAYGVFLSRFLWKSPRKLHCYYLSIFCLSRRIFVKIITILREREGYERKMLFLSF